MRVQIIIRPYGSKNKK